MSKRFTTINSRILLVRDDVGQFRELQEEAQETSAKTEEELAATAGWVIELKCHHYHNGEKNFNKGNWGRWYVIGTMVEKLINGTVEFPGKEDDVEGGGEYRFTDFGISYPTLVDFSEDRFPEIIRFGPDGVVGEDMGSSLRGDEDAIESFRRNGFPADEENPTGGESETVHKPMRYDFTIQMAWLPRSPKERLEAKKKRLEEEKAAAEAAAAEAEAAAKQQ